MTRTHHHDVMLSSTSRDLPDYREKVKDAVLRASCHPLMMELDGAMHADAIGYSLGLVDEAELYVGIFAHRYGYIPPGQDISITEMEYRRARENGIACLIFVIDADYAIPVTPKTRGIYFEEDDAKAEKLATLKEDLLRDHVVAFFKEPENLAYQVFEAITKLKDSGHFSVDDIPEAPSETGLPVPPEPFIAHPYVLTRTFLGRTRELALIDAWAASDDPVLIFQAIGGMGKSALTWHWTEQHAEAFDGVVWWSFYESDGSFENFVRYSLAYLTGQSYADVGKLTRHERRQQLLAALENGRYLLVLDGLERAMVAYHRMDAPMRSDDDVEAEKRAAHDDAPLRSCTDPEHGLFLSRLANVRASKVLVSTRLMPHDLEDKRLRQPLRGVERVLLRGLTRAEALGLLRHLGVDGDADAMARFTEYFGNHALMLNVIAGLVLNYRGGPGDFDAWYDDEGRDMRMTELDLTQRRTHVLGRAMRMLSAEEATLLGYVSAFRYPVDYDVLRALNPYLPPAPTHTAAEKRAANRALNAALAALEDAGLLQWDRAHNRYDLHPVVRAYAYETMDPDERRGAHLSARDYFETMPEVDRHEVQEVDDLRFPLEVYHALLGAGEHDLAASFYRGTLSRALFYTIGAYEFILEQIKPLFPDGLTEPPAINNERLRSYILNHAGVALSQLGRFAEAIPAGENTLPIDMAARDGRNLSVGVSNLADNLREAGRLAAADRGYRLALRLARALDDTREIATISEFLMECHIRRGDWGAAERAYVETQPAFAEASRDPLRLDFKYLPALVIRSDDATDLLNSIAASPDVRRTRWAIADFKRWHGEDALNKGDLAGAKTHLTESVALFRTMKNYRLYGVYGRLALVCARLGEADAARNWLAQALARPDDREVLVSAAETHLELGDHDAARDYAEKAYAAAWADGPPFSYWWEQTRAWRVLAALGETDEPALQARLGLHPFDPAKVEKFAHEDDVIAFIEEKEVEIQNREEKQARQDQNKAKIIERLGTEPDLKEHQIAKVANEFKAVYDLSDDEYDRIIAAMQADSNLSWSKIGRLAEDILAARDA